VLAAGLEHDPAPEGSGDGGAAAFLRGPCQLFADVIPPHAAVEGIEKDTFDAQPAPVIPPAQAPARAGTTPRRAAS
jgi:hypothetical protein